MSGRTFGMQSLRLIGRPFAGVARWRWPGPEVLLSLLLEIGLYPTRPSNFKRLAYQSGFCAFDADHANVEMQQGLDCFQRPLRLQFLTF